MDKLKSRIETLRDELEQVETPDQAAIWEKLEPHLRQPIHRSGRKTGLYLIAAALLLLAGLLLGYRWGRSCQPAPAEQPGFADLSPEYRSRVSRYRDLVQQKERALKVNAAQQPELAALFGELQELDDIHREFVRDYNSLPKDDRTAHRILGYYEQKIRILELIIKEIHIQNNEKERNQARQL